MAGIGNKGKITVFLCLLIVSMLLVGLTALEITRIHMDRAKVIEASKGAMENLKADYNVRLFEDYHLLLLDRTYAGAGEGALEERVIDYLDYTLNGDEKDVFVIDEAALTDYVSIMDNDCQVLKAQIIEYMKLYSEIYAVESLVDMITDHEDPSDNAVKTVENGQMEENESVQESSWEGDDPREVLADSTSAGLLTLVVPQGRTPSKQKIDLSDAPSARNGVSDEKEMGTFSFDNIESLEDSLSTSNSDCILELQEDTYGILYALECFDYFTSEKEFENPLELEVEYLIAGKDNDYDNLSYVVNMIVMHRLAFNFVYLMTDQEKLAEVESIALALSLVPGVSYGVVKYLLLGCWAYGETIVEIKSLLAGNKIPFVKTEDTWLTDIENLGKLSNIESLDYKGVNGIDYKGFLMIFLAEHLGSMYYRMCDVMQLNLREQDEDFLISNCIYAISMDIRITGYPKYVSFIHSQNGIENIDENVYNYSFSVESSY